MDLDSSRDQVWQRAKLAVGMQEVVNLGSCVCTEIAGFTSKQSRKLNHLGIHLGTTAREVLYNACSALSIKPRSDMLYSLVEEILLPQLSVSSSSAQVRLLEGNGTW